MKDFLDIAAAQGWSVETQFNLLWEFIDKLDTAFEGMVIEELANFALQKQEYEKGWKS